MGRGRVVLPPHILTAMVEEAVTVGDLVRLLRLEGGKVALVEMRLPDQSPNVGRALYELRLPADTTLVAILREGHVIIRSPRRRSRPVTRSWPCRASTPRRRSATRHGDGGRRARRDPADGGSDDAPDA